jgi:dolichyl-phosphate-mannose-protein mannosyltransferase
MRPDKDSSSAMRYKRVLIGVIVALAATLTIFREYTQPPNLFWDENYHIAAAQKYLSRVFFMEPHPPLGKLLISLGEALIDANPNDSALSTTDHAKSIPQDFSFSGFRLFPVVLSAAACVVFYILLLQITGSPWISGFFAICTALDNGLVVHFRGAMLDGIQIFFMLGFLAGVAMLYRRLSDPLKRLSSGYSLLPYLTGASIGAAVATKVTSLVALLFLVVLFPVSVRSWRATLKLLIQIGVSAFVVYTASWIIHIRLGEKIKPELPNNGYYQASERTKTILNQGVQSDLASFWPILSDHLAFFSHYERGVPKPNMCNLNETGSSPFLWPLGGRSINYRWDRKDGLTRYTYLVVNPVVWGIALVSLIVAAAFWLAATLGGHSVSREWRLFSGAFLLIWTAYMATMLSLARVMYLYHYFIPLLASLALGALTLPLVRIPNRINRLLSAIPSYVKAVAATLVVFAGFRFYSPLTYGYPISNEQLRSRAILDLWDLRCPDCELTNNIARPVCNPKEKHFPQVRIDSLWAEESYQEWGEPVQGLAVEKQEVLVQDTRYATVIGTHAASTLRFPIKQRFSSLRGKAALPDYLRSKEGKPASVIFEVWVDGIQVWSSRLLTPSDPAQDFEIPVVGGNSLELRTSDGGDGNNNDHAVWVDLHLR